MKKANFREMNRRHGQRLNDESRGEKRSSQLSDHATTFYGSSQTNWLI